jgi:acyl-CoA thioester hydrolase
MTRVRCPVYFDELDSNGHLHNTRFAVHVERATTAFFAAAGFDTLTVDPRPPDLRYVVKQFGIEFCAPFRGAGEMVVDLRVQTVGRTSLLWAFDCYTSSELVCARGSRALVKVDERGLPAPWSGSFRSALGSAELMNCELGASCAPNAFAESGSDRRRQVPDR